MTSDATFGFQAQKERIAERRRTFMPQRIRLAVALLLAATAYAQYGGGGGTTGTGTSGTTGTSSTPSYGHGKAIGIGVGAAAAGVGAVYLLTHRASKVTGCVETTDDGLHLTDDKTKKTLSVVPGGANVKPGERVELKGKIKKNAAGEQSFLVKSVGKDFGQCRTQANAGPATALNAQAK